METKINLKWVEEFYNFLQGDIPKGIYLGHGQNPRLSPEKAFSIIWYLQEHFPLLIDNIEKCSNCDSLYDCNSEGLYCETKGKFYCGGCKGKN